MDTVRQDKATSPCGSSMEGLTELDPIGDGSNFEGRSNTALSGDAEALNRHD